MVERGGLAKMVFENIQRAGTQVCPGMNAQTIHASGGGWANTVECAHWQRGHKGLPHPRRNNKQSIGFAMIRRQLGQKFIVGHPGRSGQPGLLKNTGPDFFRNSCSRSAAE